MIVTTKRNTLPFYILVMIIIILYMCSYLSNIVTRYDKPRRTNGDIPTQSKLVIDSLMNQTEIDRIDYKYCAGPCRFLSLYRIPEQGIYFINIQKTLKYTK